MVINNIDEKGLVSIIISNYCAVRSCAHNVSLCLCILIHFQAGADPCATNATGRTPLHDACQGGHVKCVELLADFDVDLDCQDQDGMAPVHVAAYHGELECLKYLKSRGKLVHNTIINV